MTFGATVPSDKVYTRVLEDMLRQDGYNVEVINIGYGGWGTDQELEALRNEGVRYKPNLVIIQFCSNDLTDNLVFANSDEQKEALRAGVHRALKPFYYTISDDGRLLRHVIV